MTAAANLLLAEARARQVQDTYDAFIDLTRAGFDGSALEDYVDRLIRHAGLSRGGGVMTLALPEPTESWSAPLSMKIDADPGQPPIVLLLRAIRRAATLRHHLVVLLEPLVPETDVLSRLIEVFERDPQFGTAQPRFAQDHTEQIWPLPGTADREWAGSRSSRAGLPFLPSVTITPELLAACVIVRRNVLVAMDDVDHYYSSIAGALLHLLCKMRRRGLRNVVVNQAVVSSPLAYRAIYPTPPDADLSHLQALYPDHDLAEAEIAGSTQRRLEPLLAAAHPDIGQRSILIDGRDIPAGHNGSSQCALGFLDGFAALDCAGQIDVLVSPEAAKFHRMAERYSPFHQLREHLNGEYFAAISLAQPWSLSRITDLHRHALLLAVTMLDTIGWDALYPPGGNGLGTVWRFLARHADALLYISQFTRERFNTRFPLDPGVVEQVTHLSFRQEEHIHPAARNEPVADHILVFGNHYDHKDLRPTVQLLVDAFPFNRIIAFGMAEALGANVTAIPSGKLEEARLHQLIAGARVMVYPSSYEGFGLPVVEGLAYGRPVIVRSSPLWAEIAGWSWLPGALIEFDDPPSLVECVGRALAGVPSPALPSGVRLAEGASPAGWKDCAGRVIALLNNRIAAADGKRWRERDDALCLAGM